MSHRLPLYAFTVVLSMFLNGCNLGALMFDEQRSPLDFDTTVATIAENAKAQGWEIPKSFDFQASLLAHGRPDPGRITVLKLCSPEIASRMFALDDSKYVAVMAPCSIAVYEKSDGQTYIASMNMKMMSRLMGQQVGPILADIAAQDEAILAFAH